MFLPIGDNVDRKSLPILPGILIFINLAVFVRQTRMVFETRANPDVLYDFFCRWGLVPSDLAEGHVVGLCTHIFMHADVMHIFGNMMMLWAFACSLELGFGALSLFGFYIFWGLGAGVIHALMSWGSDVPLVGASGAIAGLVGAYTVMYGAQSKIKLLIFLVARPFRVEVPALAFGIGWFGLQVWSASHDSDGLGGVAWYAHIGGFLLGAATAWIVRNDTDQELVHDKGGELTFKSRSELAAEQEQSSVVEGEVYAYLGEAPEEAPQFPGFCPYCDCSLNHLQEIAPGVARCPSASCERILYAGSVLMPSR